MQQSSFGRGTWGKSGKMSVICLSESAEVLMRGLEYRITRAAAETVQCSQAVTATATTPCLLPLYHTFSLCLSFVSVLSSPTLTHTSLFLGLSPLCLTILLSLWFSQSLQSSAVSLLLHIPSNSTSILPLSVILKLLSWVYASTIHHCLYAGPDSAYITLDTISSSVCSHWQRCCF